MDYQSKIITVGDAIKKVKTGSKIVAASFASQPKSFLSFLHTLPKNITNLSIYNVYLLDYPFLQENRFIVYSTFYSGALRAAENARGNVRYIPAHVSQFPAIYAGINPDIFVGAASMPKDGKVSLSLANLYDRQSLEAAKTVILEINPNFPYTKGSVEVDLAKVNYIIEADYKPLTIEESALGEKDIIIGNLIAAEIKDGDCLQFGIGAIPDAVANALVKKKHLGIHTEMLTNGALKLILSGAVDNSKKKIGKGKSTTVFACGSQALYDYMHNNDAVEMLDADYVNSPSIIAQNDNQVSINSTIEVDFFGQCASETLGTKHFSGSGGQFDTVQGAKWSKGGRSY
ncbi:MAG: 4-hydroxybutyrate--acetyl-CoA CoA transferase, partial [Firmicutes bacterium]|nr:4-hydroxybutyrate--acetyl-CoA CoA transferase [Bacillota bacterium]